MRHGAASADAAEGRRGIAEVQVRLRHQTDSSTRRYARHARYFAELAKVSPPLVQYGELIERRLGDLLSGLWVPPKPPGIASGSRATPAKRRRP